MPLITRLLLLLLSPVLVSAQLSIDVPVPQRLSNYNLQEDVKTVYEISYAINLAERVMPDSTVFTDTLLTKSKEINMAFNEQGYLQVSKTDSFDADGKGVLSKETRYYYEGSDITGIVHIQDGKLTDSVYIGYNRKGLPEEQVFYNRKQRKQSRLQYFYRNGRPFNIKLRDDKDMLVTFYRFEYDQQGNLTEQEIKGSTMQYVSSIKYDYDMLQNGNRQVNKYDYVGSYDFKGMEGYILNPLGRLIQVSVMDSNKRMISQKTMEYNKHGLVKSELIFNSQKYDYSYSYEYDDKGYWKTRRKNQEGVPVSKTHRVIELYSKPAD